MPGEGRQICDLSIFSAGLNAPELQRSGRFEVARESTYTYIVVQASSSYPALAIGIVMDRVDGLVFVVPGD
jgi:hypothetical protein